MLTRNYNLDLMQPDQPYKDVVFNEALTKLDSFINLSIEAILEMPPEAPVPGNMHIVKNGPNPNYIYYCISEKFGWRIQKPIRGMIFFVNAENKFFRFDGTMWAPITISA